MSHVFFHPWLGKLFGDAEAAGIWSADMQLRHMLAFEAAYTRALGAVGRIDEEDAESTAQAISEAWVDLDSLNEATARDGVVIPDLVAQLRRATGVEGPALHKGTTSQDVIDTALALTIRDYNSLLADRLTALETELAALTERFHAAPMMGRTRMQAALPITVADRISTWALPLQGHQTRLAAMRPRLEALQFGGAAGDRAATSPHGDEIAAHMAKALGLSNPPRAWHATREGVVDYANLLSLVTGTLGKMGQDICLMAQQGVDEIKLSGGGGSSAMPHKQNPVLAELLVTLARFNAVQVSGMHHAMIHEQERSGAAWSLEWMILPQMAEATARSLSAAIELCGQITRIGQA